MNKRIILLFVLMSAFTVSGADRPEWVNNPQSGCKKLSELCAVGMGTGRDEAIRNAKIEIAKIFSTNISANFASSLAANSGQTSEDIQEDVREETQGVLEGVQTDKIYEQQDGFFVLAVLDKRQAAEGLKLKITDLDSEIKTIFNGSDETSKTRLKKLFAKRQALNQTYLFVAGAEIPSPTASDLIFKSNKSAMKNVVVHIYFDEKEPKPFEAATIKSFSDMGYKITTGPVTSANATHLIAGKVIAEKQFINVKGFRKYKVVLKVAASSSTKKVETGHLNLESTATGRNYQQAYEGAVKEISNELKNKIADLNIE